MRIKRFSRSSRPTGPKIRVPRGLQLIVDQHRRVLVETDVAAVRPAVLLLGPHNDAAHHVALLDGRTGYGVLHGRDEHIADPGVTATSPTEDLYAKHFFRARVVGYA